jgi:hypothetical protein
MEVTFWLAGPISGVPPKATASNLGFQETAGDRLRQEKSPRALILKGFSDVLGRCETSWNFVLVAKGGIEPPTRGFSIRCSTN